jgi:dihydrofolate reductase
MAIKIIVAMAANGIIGKDNDIPWRGKLPADMKRFKEITIGYSVLMGRKTYESIPAKFRPLPDRHNIVLTSHPASECPFADPRISIASSLEEGIRLSQTPHVFILGGGTIYAATINLASELYVTIVNYEFQGDTYFPTIDTSIWEAARREDHPIDEKNKYPYSFVKLVRNKK